MHDERKPEPTRLYWVGTKETCPVANVHLAGVCLPRYTDPPIPEVRRRGKKQRRAYRKGDFVELSERKVREIRQAARKRVCWWTSSRKRGGIYHVDYPGYRAGWTTEPLERHIYVMPADEGAPSPALLDPPTPPPLSETAEERAYAAIQTARKQLGEKVPADDLL